MPPLTRKAAGLPVLRRSVFRSLTPVIHNPCDARVKKSDWMQMYKQNTAKENIAPQSFCDKWMFSQCTPDDAISKAALYDRMCLRRWPYFGLRLARKSANTGGVGLRAGSLTFPYLQHCPKRATVMKRSGCLPCRTTAMASCKFQHTHNNMASHNFQQIK